MLWRRVEWGMERRAGEGESMIVLQARDKRILQIAREHHFVMVDQVQPLFDGGSYKRTAQRIAQLRKGGFLMEEPRLWLGRRPLYRLTAEGAKVAAEGSSLQIRPRRNLDPMSLAHEAVLTSVRVILEESLTPGEFASEEAIAAKGCAQMPDGIFFFENGRGIAIEVEDSFFSQKCFLETHERWEEEPDIFFVLFVATSHDLVERIRDLILQVKSDQPFGVVLWNDLRSGQYQIWSPERTWQLSDLKSRLAGSLPQTPSPEPSAS